MDSVTSTRNKSNTTEKKKKQTNYMFNFERKFIVKP
jgi:hypothetical protein